MATEPGSDDGAVFGFSDLQALREEYEERIARIERERDASVAVLRHDCDARISAEARARQELIEDLTIELASAREEGERRAVEAERRRALAEEKLAAVRSDVARLEAECGRIRTAIEGVLSKPSELVALPPVATIQHVAVAPSTPPQAARPSTPPATSTTPPTIGMPQARATTTPPTEKRRRIRLR